MLFILGFALAVLFGCLVVLAIAPTGDKDDFEGHGNIYDRCDWGSRKDGAEE